VVSVLDTRSNIVATLRPDELAGAAAAARASR
jgi:hypothetical protein